jgi:hypothetical protein
MCVYGFIQGIAHKVHIYLEYHSVYPLVLIGHPRGVEHTRLQVRERGVPIRTTGKKSLALLSTLWESLTSWIF